MELVKEEAYASLIKRIDAMELNTLFARSVLTRDVGGVVYANREAAPSAWYIVHAYGMSLLFGDSGDERFQRDLTDRFRTLSKGEWIQGYPDSWVPFLDTLVREGLGASYSRVNFAFDANRFRAGYEKPERSGLEVRRTPLQCLRRLEGSVVPKDFWKAERFSDCVGYTVFVGDVPASTAFSAYRHGNRLEIGIETAEAYRGKGFARMACGALIRHCLDRDLVPYWSCRYENTGSLRLAGSLGFVMTKRLPYYRIP